MKTLISNLFPQKKTSNCLSTLTYKQFAELYDMDESLFPIVQRAREDSISAQYGLYEAFKEGSNVDKDLDAASYYLLLTMHTLSKNLNQKDNILMYLSCLIEFALLEKQLGNYKSMKNVFYDVILFMQKYIPFEEWDFSIFHLIGENLKSVNQ